MKNRRRFKLWTPDKITSMIMVVGCMVLLLNGINGEVKSILSMAAGYLFCTGIYEKKITLRGDR